MNHILAELEVQIKKSESLTEELIWQNAGGPLMPDLSIRAEDFLILHVAYLKSLAEQLKLLNDFHAPIRPNEDEKKNG